MPRDTFRSLRSHQPHGRLPIWGGLLAIAIIATACQAGDASETPVSTTPPTSTVPTTSAPVGGELVCTITVDTRPALLDAIERAEDNATICLADGSYGAATITTARSGFVTVVSQNPGKAVFESILLDDASFIRFRQITVLELIENGQDGTHDIAIEGSALGGVFVQAPPRNVADAGPSNWAISYNDIADCEAFCVALVSENPENYWPVSDVVVRGNKIGPLAGGEDAIRIHNWQNIVIEGNEIFGIIEDGQHNDCLQSVWGGKGLTFSYNYLHDNNCQTFFLKDGYTQDVLFEENLSVRNRAGDAPVVAQIWPSANVTIQNNTLWDGSAFYLRIGSYSDMFSTGPTTGFTVQNNVIDYFVPYDDEASDSNRAGAFRDPAVLDEDFNLFGEGWTWVPSNMGSHSVEDLDPPFAAPSADLQQDFAIGDWRLARPLEVGGMSYTPGISWELAGRLFGTAAYPSDQ